MKQDIKDIDAYIHPFPDDVRAKLETLRQTIRDAAPEAVEVISYQMPAFRYHGILVYFAGYKNHIGFYPTSSGISVFKEELSGYKNAKGSVQFSLNQPLPIELISNIVKFRLKENLEKEEAKKKKRSNK
jgi:uncharacterized protein YdhG (YjbR/CyaY superfamily)